MADSERVLKVLIYNNEVTMSHSPLRCALQFFIHVYDLGIISICV